MNCGAKGVPSPSLPDILGAVDDHQMAPRVEEAGVAGLEPAVGGHGLAGGIVLLVVAEEDAGQRTSTSPFSAIRTLACRQQPADGVGIDLAVGLQRRRDRRSSVAP